MASCFPRTNVLTAISLCLVLHISQELQAQMSVHPAIKIASPADAGMLPERLRRIDVILQEAVDKQWANGVAALIVHNGKVAYYNSFGFNDLESRQPLRKDHIFRIASQTKAITSVAIMMLYEEGKFLLDDPVSNYIPSFKNPGILSSFNEKDTTYTTVPDKKEITIRHLLSHTSGIGYAQIGEGPINAIYGKYHIACGLGVHNGSLSEDIQQLGRLPLLHEPGEKFTYGLNVDVLGYLVEILSGMTLDEFFRKRIFELLGMKDTHFYLPKEKCSRLANLYLVDSTGKLTRSPGWFTVGSDTLRDYPASAGSYYAGGAGLSSTIMDYAFFLQMLLNGGEYNGKRILGRNTVRMMTTNQIGSLSLGADKFGLGFEIVTEESSGKFPTPAGTFSWGGAFSTTYWADPKEKIIGLLYRQLWDDRHESELNNKFKVLVYQALSN